MHLKLMGTLAAAALLVGCAQRPAETASASGTGAAASGIASGLPSVAPGSEEDLAQNVGDRVFFGFDKTELTPEDQATLDKQAEWLARYPAVRVLIAGNTDERGTEEYNIALGQRRANVVRDYLAARGVAPNRISTISYGKERPQPGALCGNESCWAKNRNAITSVATP